MKKFFRLVTLSILATAATLSANAEMIGFGLSAGANSANFSIKGYDGAVSNNTGWQVGASASLSFPFLSLTPEIWYLKNNFTVTNSNIAGGSFNVKTNAVTLPVIAGFTIIGPLKLELGPSFTLYDNATATMGAPIGEVDLGSVRSKVGYVAGAKLTVMKKIILGARFNGQFGGRDNAFNSNNTFRVRNYSYSFSIGYKL